MTYPKKNPMTQSTRFVMFLASTIAFIFICGNPAMAQTAPALQSAASRKNHAGVTYDLGLPLTGATGIEPRNLATGLTIVFNFDKSVASANAAVTAGAATVSNTTCSGNQVLIDLTNVANAQAVTLSLSSIVATGGSSAGSASVTFRLLEGDVNGSGSVSVADVNLVKYYVGQPLTGFTFRADCNASGSISVSDVNLAKFRVGTSVAGGPAANTAPTISNIVNQSTTTATATPAIAFTVGDGETPAYALTLRASSDNQTLLPDASIALGGSGAARTIACTPAAGQTGTATITVLVSDGLMTSSDTFVLTVSPASTGGGSAGGTGTTQLFVTALAPEASSVTSASGSATLQLSADQTYAIVHVTYSNLTTTRTGWHVHGPADPGQTGGVLFDLDINAPQPDGSWKWVFVQSGNTAVADQIAAIKAGRTYVNVHSSKYPAGEIRGNFLATAGSQTFTAPAAPPALPSATPSQTDAVRFLAQATYGPTDDSINQVISQGYDTWITNQFNTPQTSQLTILQGRTESVTFNQYWDSWWKLANTAPDQLRQRVAFSLSEMFVVSQNKSILSQFPFAMANYYDMLGRDGFGNFRQLLEDVTLNPMMGEYLDLRGNQKADPSRNLNPNENYAREVMQLFTIGLNQLWPDGTLKLDANGQPIPTYDQNVVIGVARALTGWDYHQTGSSDLPAIDYINPMTPVPQSHETGTKQILDGVVIPAGGTNAADLKTVLDALFNHPNLGPFISRQLIKKLVCSNPSPGYVYRVAQKFNNNGSGVRGDMQAVIRAILTDYEARSIDMIAQQGYGKLREPLLRTTYVMRAFHAYSFYAPYNWSIDITDDNLGQTPMNSPTVFNFYDPNYVFPGVIAQAGLVAPEFQITNETTTMTVANWFYWGIGYGFKYGDIKLDLTTETGIAANAAALVDRLNLRLCAGQMTDAAKSSLVTYLNTLPVGDPLTRAKVAVYMMASSAQFAVQR
jgi:uncharacterized protein (DUF1800 family)